MGPGESPYDYEDKQSDERKKYRPPKHPGLVPLGRCKVHETLKFASGRGTGVPPVGSEDLVWSSGFSLPGSVQPEG